eukprot:531151-Pleurochrysis_carterae.AAC.2
MHNRALAPPRRRGRWRILDQTPCHPPPPTAAASRPAEEDHAQFHQCEPICRARSRTAPQSSKGTGCQDCSLIMISHGGECFALVQTVERRHEIMLVRRFGAHGAAPWCRSARAA